MDTCTSGGGGGDRKKEGERGYLLVRMKGAKSSRDKAEVLDVTTESTSSM